MNNLQFRLIEGIESDFNNIKEFEEGKSLRKECSLLLKRMESAKKLCLENNELSSKLISIEKKITELLK